MKVLAVLLAGLGLASAFISRSGPMTSAVVRQSQTVLKMGYVPDGLTPAQYKAIKAKEEAQAKKNKKTAMKGSVEDLTTFQARRDAKYPNQPGAGHVYVKLTGNALKNVLKPRAAKD